MKQSDTQLFVLVMMGAMRRLIELSSVREVVPAMQLAKPSGISGACRGLANLRGEIVPVFDPDGHAPQVDAAQLIVVMVRHGGLVGVLVDDVMEIVQIEAREVVRHPAGNGSELCTVNLDGRAVTVFQVEEALNAA
jgi:chemotaxis signal transduction protein